MSQTPFKLTVKDVLIAGRKAMNEGTLQATSAEACASGECGNVIRVGDKEYYCIIGSAFSPELRTRFPVSGLPGLVQVDKSGKINTGSLEPVLDITKEDYEILADLQRRHDEVVSAVSDLNSFLEGKWEVSRAKKRFRDQFRKLEIKYGLRPARAS